MREIDQFLTLLERAGDGDTAAASELLSRLREFREAFSLPFDPDSGPLLSALLEELWQGGCEAVYGDLCSVQERRLRCESLVRQLAALHPCGS